MFTASTLDLDGIRHGFMTREGGQSTGIYASLNCGPGSADDADAVQANRRIALQESGLGDVALVTCHQIHSASAVVVKTPWAHADAPKADALVTNQKGLALGILTADCAPVLFADEHAGVIAAAHAGWRGAVGGVLQATVEQMQGLGARADTIHAAVGPCIHQASYEVGKDMRDEIIARSFWANWCFEPGARPGHFQFDLPSYVSGVLQSMKLGRVEILPHDTYSDETQFFSYRRTTHAGEPDYGRQISLIGLTD